MMLTRKLALFLAVALLLPGLASGNDVKDFLWEGFLPIPDGSGEFVGATIDVPGDGTVIKDVDVDILIEHTWQGDLIIELEHDGVRVPLIYRAGDSQSGGFGFSEDNFGGPNGKFIFDDEAAEFYDSAPPNGRGNVPDPGINSVGGSWIPYGEFETATLGSFDGMDKAGEWTLWVSDNAGADTGALLQFSLHIANVPEPSALSLLALGGLALLRRRRR